MGDNASDRSTTDSNYGNQSQSGITGSGTGTAPTTAQTGPIKVVTDEEGAVKIGTWKTLPPGYEAITNHDTIVEALMNFTASDLRLKIADLCVNRF